MFWLGLIFSLPLASAMRHGYNIRTVRNLVAPIGTPYGFLTGGHFELKVNNFQIYDIRKPHEKVAGVEAGFYLKRFDNEAHFATFVEGVRANRTCVFEYEVEDEDDPFQNLPDVQPTGEVSSVGDGILLSMNSGARSISYKFKPDEEGLYFLMYQVCPPKPMIRSNFEVEYHWYNFDSLGKKSYLPAGEMHLPLMFLFFSISYFVCFVIWALNIRKIQDGGQGLFALNSAHRPVIYAIHHLMSVMVFLKFASVLAECIRYHVIQVTGTAEVWTFIYYTVNFVKGVSLFVVILLLGSGWSIVKPILNKRERNVVFAVLILQCINQLALTVLSQEISGEQGFDSWTALLHLVDIVCCCVVLIPIVWQVNALEKSIGEAEEEELPHDEMELLRSPAERTQILSKLRVFRSFYLLVVAYIYATRILVYLFATVLDYRHIWVRYFAVELVTLTFYIMVGLMFRPIPEGMYASVVTEEEASVPLPRREEGLEMELVEQGPS